MKVLSKVTIGVVAILSLCSCNRKGTKTTKEKFIEKLSDIKTKDSFKSAKVTYTYSYSTNSHGDITKVKKTYFGTYENYQNGLWDKNEDNDVEADYMFENMQQWKPGTIVENDYPYVTNVKEKFYIKPYGCEITANSKERDASYYTYYEWDDYGFLVYLQDKFEVRDKTEEYSDICVIEIKVTYL